MTGTVAAAPASTRPFGQVPRRLCILVGPTRTATTSLFRYFARAPGVVASRRKETNYFLKDVLAGIAVPETDFAQCFDAAQPGRVRFEASPLYFMLGRRVAERIRAAAPHAHVVVTLRDPVQRFFSARTMINNKRNIGLGIERSYGAREFYELCAGFDPATLADFGDINAMTLAEGRYGQLLAEWLDTFPPSQVHLLLHDWLFSAEGQERIGRVMGKALGLDGRYDAGPLLCENRSRDVRNTALHRLAYGVNRRLEGLLNRHQHVRNVLRGAYYAINEAGRDREDAETTALVRRYYAEDLRALDRLLGAHGWSERPDWLAGTERAAGGER
jgi:hypothetical protein